MTSPKAARDNALTTKELCAWLKIGETTARDWRRDGTGPLFSKKGGFVRYLEGDVMAWLKAHRRESNAA